MKRIALIFAVFFCFAAVVSSGEEKAETPVQFRSLYTPGCSAYMEIPSADGLLRASADTALGKLLTMEQVSKLLSDDYLSPGLFELTKTVLTKYKWGIAAGVYPEIGYVVTVRTKGATGREFFDAIMAVEEGVQFDEVIKPVEGREGLYKSQSGLYLLFDKELLFVASKSEGLERVGRATENSLGKVLAASSAPSVPANGYFVYLSLASVPYTDIFDEGWERPFARLTGLSSVGTVHWTGRPLGKRFSDKLVLKPRSTGWSGIATSAKENASPEFTGRLSDKALFSMAAELSASQFLKAAMSEATDEEAEALGALEEDAQAEFGMSLYDALDSAWTGEFEFAVSLPSGGFIPRMALRAGTSDPEKAQALFEMLNERAVNLLPLLTTVDKRKLYYRKPIAELAYTPCATFAHDSLLAASSTIFVRTLANKEASAFPPLEGYGANLAQRLKENAVASFVLDGKQTTRWLYNGLLVARAGGIELPFDPAQLPLPDEMAVHFSYSAANITLAEGDIVFESSADIPVAGAAALVWMMVNFLQ